MQALTSEGWCPVVPKVDRSERQVAKENSSILSLFRHIMNSIIRCGLVVIVCSSYRTTISYPILGEIFHDEFTTMDLHGLDILEDGGSHSG